MDWSNLTAVLAGVVGTHGYLWIRERLNRPYRWKCPHCDFKMAMSEESPVFSAIRVDHIHSFHHDHQ